VQPFTTLLNASSEDPDYGTAFYERGVEDTEEHEYEYDWTGAQSVRGAAVHTAEPTTPPLGRRASRE
jgi:hypothetical protein